MSSWVKVSRKLVTSAIAAKPEYLAVWIHLLLSASYKEGEFLVGRQIVRLKPGQLIFGRHKFSEKTGVSESIVRSALKVLENLQQITIKSESKFSIISITNWAHYQESSPTKNQIKTSTSPAVDHNKEVLEIQEEDQKHLSLDEPNDPPKKDRIDYEAIRNSYNDTCGHVLPKCRGITEKRKALIKGMLAIKIDGVKPFEVYGIPYWSAYFADAILDPHKRGENDRGWKADFEHLANKNNAIKILEKNLG